MSRLIGRIQAALDRQMPEGQGARVKPRGFSIPLDPYTTGTIRYGRKIGYELPLIVPDNKFNLEEAAVFDTNQVVVDRVPTWIESGGYITVGNRELHEVEDVADETIILASNLLADHPENQPVYHYSNPITVEGAYSAGQVTVNLDTPSFIVVGDKIGITPAVGLDVSFVEYQVTSIRFVGVSGNDNQYQVVLDRGIHRALTDGEVVQILAYPAYKSEILDIPQPGVAELPVIGPYLLDWVSAPLIENVNADEVQTYQPYNSAHLPIGSPVTIDKNHQVLRVPIRADQLLFWDKVAGSVNYHKDKKQLLATLDSDGRWWINYFCAPVMSVPFVNAQGLIVCVEKALLANNEGFRVPDDVDAVYFEYKVDGTYVKTTETASSAIITATGIPTDNETFTLDDGFGNVVTFEFKRTAGFLAADPSYRTVDVTTSALVTDVAIAMENAINAVTTLGITTNNSGLGVLNLVNDIISLNGNTTIVETSAALTITQQFLGGTDRVETIDISDAAVTTAVQVAQLTAAALNRSGLNLDAYWPTTAPGIRLTSRAQGALGNGAITDTVAATGFVVQGMSGGSGGNQWNFKINPNNDVTLRVHLYPNAIQDYVIPAGSTTSVAISLSSTDEPVERIDILLSGPAGTEVYIGDWTINGPRVSAVQHTYVAHVKGERNYASTSLWAKPLFHSLEDLRIRFDTGKHFDTGGIKV